MLFSLVRTYSFYCPNSHAFLYLLLACKLFFSIFILFYIFICFCFFILSYSLCGYLLYTNITRLYIVILDFVGYLNYINILIPLLSYSCLHGYLCLLAILYCFCYCKKDPHYRENDMVFKKRFPRVAWEWLNVYILFYLCRF